MSDDKFNDILSWFSNFLNFLILVFLVYSTINTEKFDTIGISLTIFGLFVSIIIQAYVSLFRDY